MDKTVRSRRPASVVARTAARRAAAPVSTRGAGNDDEGVRAEFGRLVASKLDGPVLRYSERVRMIRHGMACGIGRFECNLIIAMEEHRAGRCVVRERSPRRRGRGWPAGWVAFALVQGAIVGGIWWIAG